MKWFKGFLRRLLVPRGPRWVRRAPKQGEWIWDGTTGRPVQFPFDTKYRHVVLEAHPRLSPWQQFIERITRP